MQSYKTRTALFAVGTIAVLAAIVGFSAAVANEARGDAQPFFEPDPILDEDFVEESRHTSSVVKRTPQRKAFCP